MILELRLVYITLEGFDTVISEAVPTLPIRLYGAMLNEAQGELNLYFTIQRTNIM